MNACFRMLLSKIYKKILLKFRIIQSRMIKRGVNSLNNRYKTQSDETEKDKIKGPKLSRFFDYHEQDHIILPALQNKNKSNFNVNFEEDSLFSFQNNKQLLGKINMSTILMHYKIEGKENKNHKYSNSTFSHIKTGHSFDETSQANSITYGKKRKKTIEAFYLDKILKEIQNQKNGMKCQQNNRIKWGANLSNSDKNNNKSRISIMLSKSDRLEQLSINFQGRKKQSTRKLSGLLSKKSLFSRKQLNNGHNIKYIKAKIILNELQSILQKHKPNVDQQTNLIKTDLNLIKQIFNKIAFHDNVFCIYRTYYFQIRSNFGKLLFFIGLELNELYLRDIFSLNLTSGSKSNFQTEQWLSKITRFLHYQIYYALLFEIHTLAMQTLLQLIRIHSNQSLKEYQKSEYFCQMLLKLSLYYNNKFYEEHALEYMGLCQYKMGDIEGARNLYENMGKISQESKNNFRSFYNQNTYIFTLKEYLFKGEELKFSENVRLIETIVFQPNKPNADESKMEIQKKNIEQLNCKARQQSPRDRLIISKISKKINEFKKNEQKLRNKKNGKIIEMLKQSQKEKSQEKDSQYLSHYYKQIKQINDSILSNKQKTGVKTKIVKTSSSSHQEIENKNGNDILISNLISKVIIDNKLVDIKKYNVVRSHETETWQKHKQKYKTESSAMIHKNIKYFKEFLNTLDLIFQEKVDNL